MVRKIKKYCNVKFIVHLAVLCLINSACIKKLNLYQGDGDGVIGKQQKIVGKPDFYYPFNKEVENAQAKITIRTRTILPEMNTLKCEIPALKYNKEWLFMLVQDDCEHAAFCRTWAAIHGKPLSREHFYELAHLQYGDLPPDCYTLGKTLGHTDGAGNEVRFSFTTTLEPEENYMDFSTTIHKGNTENEYRFAMKDGLFWGNVMEMMNYGVGIAYHDVQAVDAYNEEDVLNHLDLARNITVNKLGRECKMLARPNGNNTYINVGLQYPHIQILTWESSGTKIYPHHVDDMYKVPIERSFYDQGGKSNIEQIKEAIPYELSKPEEERSAIYAAVHRTDNTWVELFCWLNDEYGKDGLDNIWMPNPEEYYEYAHYRLYGQITPRRVDDYTLELTVNLPGREAFYYPSVTVNLSGLEMEDVISIDTDDAVTGFSYAECKPKDCIMFNLDCRKHLAEHAENFVERYEADPNGISNKADALYFVNMLKESAKKEELLKRIK